MIDIVGLLADPLAYPFMQRALLAAFVVGVVCAVMGTFVVLKGLAFIGDAVSHAAFPGLVIAYMLGWPLYVGGAIAAVATSLAIGWVSRRSQLRFDTSVGVLFAGMFALGIVLFSTLRNYVADLLSYLIGNVLAITVADLVQVVVLGAGILVVVILLRKELLFATFDPAGAAASGLPVAALEYGLLALLGVTIIVSIQAVGIILVVAMLVTPAAAAQLLVTRFDRMMITAIAISAISTVVGLYLSFYFNIASGATIVLVQTGIFLVVLVGRPGAGIFRRAPSGDALGGG